MFNDAFQDSVPSRYTSSVPLNDTIRYSVLWTVGCHPRFATQLWSASVQSWLHFCKLEWSTRGNPRASPSTLMKLDVNRCCWASQDRSPTWADKCSSSPSPVRIRFHYSKTEQLHGGCILPRVRGRGEASGIFCAGNIGGVRDFPSLMFENVGALSSLSWQNLKEL